MDLSNENLDKLSRILEKTEKSCAEWDALLSKNKIPKFSRQEASGIINSFKIPMSTQTTYQLSQWHLTERATSTLDMTGHVCIKDPASDKYLMIPTELAEKIMILGSFH
jgi:hypothetical protein